MYLTKSTINQKKNNNNNETATCSLETCCRQVLFISENYNRSCLYQKIIEHINLTDLMKFGYNKNLTFLRYQI